MASSRSGAFPTQNGVTVLVSPVILWTLMLLISGLTDVIANDFGQFDFVCGRCYCHIANGFCNLDFIWLVLLPCCFDI